MCQGFGFFAASREAGFAAHAVWFFAFVAGIRDLLLVCQRCPCAGRHLLFFAAAKKSRQKKAAQTANAKWGPWFAQGSGATGIWVRAPACASDKGVILPAALRAPKRCS